ncbi:hypothetical protein [Nannocystis sp. SCPEA4]|uniref:hypothetical protein n=1 Tax=Nannocystis sp. SCPEA4 TaxID=2996787 RepID=UPI00226E14B9|nr:hypothetical protein [Nannocystis sp. SCPEA4]MCY1058216.1 hypothetical protein [Nannocystis sp. SCPEA4]
MTRFHRHDRARIEAAAIVNDAVLIGCFIDALDIGGLRLDIDMRSGIYLARFVPDGSSCGGTHSPTR